MANFIHSAWTTVFIGILSLSGQATAAPPDGKPVFERDVQPILAARCVQCHGSGTPAAGLDLRTAAAISRGAADGPVVIQGAAESSPLVQRVTSRSMPPKGAGQPLTDAEIEIIRKWIDAGAPAETPAAPPAKPAAAPAAESQPVVRTVSAKDRDFWAFRKPVAAPVPKVKQASKARTPIDSFLLARLEAKGLTYSPEASKQTLMRRAYFDLVGVPPSLEEIREYQADTKPDAYDRLIDRLLASPRYGERWGRHWLDASGYNDEQGFANDLKILVLNDGIWRYRDYVIRSFNGDKGYDRFLTEQLAGDELVDWKQAAKFTPEIRDSLVATGYLRLMTDLTDSPEVDHPPYYFDVLTRVVDNFSTGVLGLTGGCARCHNHKYDPISQRDYYSLLAVFATGYNPEHWKRPKERYLPDVSKAEQDEITKFNAEIDRPVGELKKQRDAIRRPYEQRLFDARLASAVPEALRADVRSAFETPKDKRNDIQKYFNKKLEDALTVKPEEVDAAMTEAERATCQKINDKVETLTKWRRSYGKIQALWNIEKPPVIRVLRRGMYETPGELVKPGFLAVLSEPGKADAQPDGSGPDGSSGYRLALARWATSRENPLTARVIVNRIWMEHFGRGIVSTPENFGRMGAEPTHPELLDWLAVDFMEHGWKMKRLHKMIIMSAAYRQSSQRPEEGVKSPGEEADPGNELLWRMNLRRLEAESMRDAVLEVSGKLDLTMGGPPVGLDSTKDGLVTVAEKGATPTTEFRRSVYLLARRNYSTSFLDVFDFPVMALNCTRRTNSATPLQSLTMLNSDFVMQRSEDFARRVADLAGPNASSEKQVDLAFMIAMGRNPSRQEVDWSTAHIAKQRERYTGLNTPAEESSRKALASLCQMLMAANGFLYID